MLGRRSLGALLKAFFEVAQPLLAEVLAAESRILLQLLQFREDLPARLRLLHKVVAALRCVKVLRHQALVQDAALQLDQAVADEGTLRFLVPREECSGAVESEQALHLIAHDRLVD